MLEKEKLTQVQAAVQRTVELSFEAISLKLAQGLRLGLKDIRLQVAKCISESYCLWNEDPKELSRVAEWEARNGSPDLALQALEIAEELGAPQDTVVCAMATAKRDATLCELLDLLPTAGREEARETAEAFGRIGAARAQTGDHYEESLQLLEQAWSLLQRFGLQSIKVSLHYGQVLSRFGKFAEAEKVMRQGLSGQQASVAAAALSNGIAEVRCQTGHWEDAVTMCEWTLHTFGESSYSFEQVQAAYILAEAASHTDKSLEALKAWTQVTGTPKCEAIRMCLIGELHKDNETYLQGAEQCQRLLPPSFFTANCLHRLGNQLTGVQAEQIYWRALQLYSKHSPCSLPYATCLNRLGALYQQQQRLQEAGQMYVQALRILALYYADSLTYVSSLTSLGMLAFAQHTPDQAEDLLQRSIKLCSSFFPNSLAYAHCSAGLATLYRSQSRIDQAIEHYLKACQLYMVHSPDSSKHAECLVELGDAYTSVRKWKEARDKYEKAAQIFSTLCLGLESHIATVCKLADTLLALQQWTLAEEQYLAAINFSMQSSLEQAKCRELLSFCYFKSQRTLKAEEQMIKASEIHLSHPTVLESCDFFAKLGVFYKQLQRPKDAEQWFTKACDLYRSRYPQTDNYAVCLANFALLHRQMHSVSDADRLVQLALDMGTSSAESIAACLVWLGALCAQRNQLQSAEELWIWACDRLEGATSLPRARCMQSLGDLYLASERCTDAEAWYMQALTVYGNLPLNADCPRCFVSLARLYEKKTLKEAAAVQIQKAKMQFGALNLPVAVSECDATLRRLRST